MSPLYVNAIWLPSGEMAFLLSHRGASCAAAEIAKPNSAIDINANFFMFVFCVCSNQTNILKISVRPTALR